jgi:UDP:flavonoid glycosyltransferase YjiC (YdhE family)
LAQTTGPHALIQSLENKRYEAVLAQDFDTLESLCHAELAYGHTGGSRDSMNTYLAKLRSGALRYHRIDTPWRTS